MATHRVSVLGPQAVPGTSGNVWQEPYTIAATNDVWGLLVYRFKDTATRIALHGGFTVPKNYVGGAKLLIYWTSTATSGNVAWDVDYRAITGDDAESLDQAGSQESATVTDAAPTAAHRLLIASITLTAGNFVADDFVEFTLFRDGADGADTMAADALVFDALFEYADA